MSAPARVTDPEPLDIWYARKDLDLRCHHVARGVGCSISYVSLVERGILFRPQVVRKIRRYLAQVKKQRMGRAGRP